MTRRKNPVNQLADDISCFIIGLLWTAAYTLLAALFKATQAILKDQNMKLRHGFAWC